MTYRQGKDFWYYVIAVVALASGWAILDEFRHPESTLRFVAALFFFLLAWYKLRKPHVFQPGDAVLIMQDGPWLGRVGTLEDHSETWCPYHGSKRVIVKLGESYLMICAEELVYVGGSSER